MNYLIKIALALFLFNALFYNELSVIWFFRLWTVIFLLLILYIWKLDETNFEKFVLFEFGSYNVIDEFFTDGSIVKKEHALIILIVPFIWYLKKIFKNDRIHKRVWHSYWSYINVYIRQKINKNNK